MKKIVLCSVLGFLLTSPIACVPPQEPPTPPEGEIRKEFRRANPGSTGIEPVLIRPGATAIEPR